MRRLSFLLVFVLVLAGSASAAAHVVSAGADLRVAQTIAGSELTVVVKGVRRVPGPLRIGIESYRGAGPAEVRLELRSVADGRVVTGRVRPGGTAELRAEQAGAHELKVSAGDESAVVPFRVLVERGGSWELAIYGGLLVAGLLAVGGLLTGAVSRRRGAMLVSAGIAASVAVAATFVVLEPYLPVPDPDGAQLAAGSRPFARVLVSTTPARPVAGQDYTLRLDVVDGATGVPVDDLAVHHEALAHLVVTSADGRAFSHTHPLRTAPGRLEVRLRAERGGRHLVHLELERQESGGQLLTGEFAVDGPEQGEPSDPAAARTNPAVPVAGRPTTIEVATGGTTRPWLGMAGHLIVRSADGTFFGHVHEMGAGGGTLRFTFGFPAPGRYLAWAQYATRDRIVTVPVTVDVPR